MTIELETCNTEWMQGDGVNYEWPWEFLIPEVPGDEEAALTFILRHIATGVETIVASSALTITGLDDDNGGSVTYPITGAAITSDYEVLIARNLPYTQGTDFGGNQGGFLPSVLEDQLDELAMQTQQNRRDIGRALLVDYGAEPATINIGDAGEVLIVGPDGNIETTPSGSLGTLVVGVDVQAHSDDLDNWGKITGKRSPFGRTGVRVLIGEDNDYHYFSAGWVHFEGVGGSMGKMVHIFRRGSNHGTRNGAAIVAADSYDKGQTFVNVRSIYTDASYDSRPGDLIKMANGRIGALVGRPSEGGTILDPLFIYSDDQGATWGTYTVARPGGATAYAFVTGQPLLNIPATQNANIPGGTGGGPSAFIAYGSMNAGEQLDAGYTLDNGATWLWAMDVSAALQPELLRYSENCALELGEDRWLFYFRNILAGDIQNNEAICVKVTNLFSLPQPQLTTGLLISASNPGGFCDQQTGKSYFLGTSRNGFVNYGLTNWFFLFEADTEALWTANGNFTGLATMQPLFPCPDWLTGYPHEGKIGDSWYFAFTSGEINNAATSLLSWCGDFVTNGGDRERWDYYLKDRVPKYGFIYLQNENNADDSWPLQFLNRSDTFRMGLSAYSLNNKVGTAQTVDFTFTIGDNFIVNADGFDGNFTDSFVVDTDGDVIMHAVDDVLLTADDRMLLTAGSAGVQIAATTRLLGGLTTPAVIDAFIQASVSSSVVGLALSNVGSSSLRKYMTLLNPTGEVANFSITGANLTFQNTQSGTLYFTPIMADFTAGTTTRAPIKMASGVAPTSPADGDIWFDGTDIKMRVGGVTKTFTLV